MHIKFSLALLLSIAGLVPVATMARSSDWRNPTALSRRELSARKAAVLSLLERRAEGSGQTSNTVKTFLKDIKKTISYKKTSAPTDPTQQKWEKLAKEWLKWASQPEKRDAKFTQEGKEFFAKIWQVCKNKKDFEIAFDPEGWKNIPATLKIALQDALEKEYWSSEGIIVMLQPVPTLPDRVRSLQQSALRWISMTDSERAANLEREPHMHQYFNKDLERFKGNTQEFRNHWSLESVRDRWTKGAKFIIDPDGNDSDDESSDNESARTLVHT